MSFNNSSSGSNSSKESANSSKFLTLCICWILIVVGNFLVIGVHKIYRRRQIPDYLILVLAVLDIVNAFGPVLISLVMYKINPHGFLGISNRILCSFYNAAATMLRLSACFVMTTMALDRAVSVEMPVYYRAVLRLKTIKRWVAVLITIAFIIACLPFAGATKVLAYQAVCSFDFGSPYAGFIAALGYFQLAIVLIAYVIVVKGLFNFVERQVAQREFHNTLATTESMRIKLADRRKSSSGQAMKDLKNFRVGKEFAKMTGLISLLFYVSWMPIVLSITVRLITGKYSEVLQFISARMSIIGSIGNPIIYAVLSGKYRKGYWYCLRRIAYFCGGPPPKHPAKESAIARMMEQNRVYRMHSTNSNGFPSPFFIAGRSSLVGRLQDRNSDQFGNNNIAETINARESIKNTSTTLSAIGDSIVTKRITFSIDTNHCKRKSSDVISSDEEHEKCAGSDVQTGFDGDAEDSDNFDDKINPNKQTGHETVSQSRSSPLMVRTKRRKLKRKAFSEDFGTIGKDDEKHERPKIFLQVPRNSTDSGSSRDVDTDTTDIETDMFQKLPIHPKTMKTISVNFEVEGK